VFNRSTESRDKCFRFLLACTSLYARTERKRYVAVCTMANKSPIVCTRDTCVASGGHEYLIVVVADRALLALDVGLADATSRHLLAVLPNGAK